MTAEQNGAGVEKAGVRAEIAAERRRQIEVEGWTPEHDDKHDRRELFAAARSYVERWRAKRGLPQTENGPPPSWPWDAASWKPGGYRRDLVRAGALVLAEIDRLTRAGEPSGREAAYLISIYSTLYQIDRTESAER